MTKQKNAWTEELLGVLAGGVWRTYEEVLDETMSSVPEELALRVAERYRSYHYKRSGRDVSTRKYGEVSDSIKTGRKTIISRAIQDMKRSGRVELEYHESELKRKRIKRLRRMF